MTLSHSERNPGRLFFKCGNRRCEFFQWVDEHPRGKNRVWLPADKVTVLFDGRVVKRKPEEILYETPLQRGVRHIVKKHMGPFEGNWHPEDLAPSAKSKPDGILKEDELTPKERLYLEKRGLTDPTDFIRQEVQKEVEWHMYK